MQTMTVDAGPGPSRRALMQRSLAVAVLLAGAGLLPRRVFAQAAWNQAAFDGKTLDEVLKALGAAKPVESKEIAITAPDIAENGAVVPLAASSALPGVKRPWARSWPSPAARAAWAKLLYQPIWPQP